MIVPRSALGLGSGGKIAQGTIDGRGDKTAAAVGMAVTCCILILIGAIYGVWRVRDVAPILSATLKESTMLMFIIRMSLLFSYVMSYLHLSQ